MRFYKYHGLGNDYLVSDCLKHNRPLTDNDIINICDRNFGIGADGILEGPYINDDGIYVKIYNPDGSEAEKSGNGIRIFSRYLKDTGYVTDDTYSLKTLGGEVEVRYNDGRGDNITVSMGRLEFTKDAIGGVDMPEETVAIPLVFGDVEYICTCVSIGNPHCVIILDEISKEIVCRIGRYSETAYYFPDRINTQIVRLVDRNNIDIEIFERGAGYTLASGSSSCAAAGAVYKLGLADSEVDVHMPGGILHVSIDDNFNAYLTGDVCYIGKMITPS